MDALKRSSFPISWSIEPDSTVRPNLKGMKFMEDLALGFCHNLRSPLSVVLMNAELIRLACERDPRIKKYAKTILEQGERLSDLIDQVAEKINRDRRKEAGWIDINELVTFELDFLRNHLYCKHQMIKELLLDESCPRIRGIYRDFSSAFNRIVKSVLENMTTVNQVRLTVRTVYREGRIALEVGTSDVHEDLWESGGNPPPGTPSVTPQQKAGAERTAECRFGRLKRLYGVTVQVDDTEGLFRLLIPVQEAAIPNKGIADAGSR